MRHDSTPPDAGDLLPLTDLSYQILLTLSDEALHGYGILKAIRERGGREPESGTLYTAIRRLRRDGLVESATEPDGGRRGRSYALTELGREAVRLESRRLADLVDEARRRSLLETDGVHGVA